MSARKEPASARKENRRASVRRSIQPRPHFEDAVESPAAAAAASAAPPAPLPTPVLAPAPASSSAFLVVSGGLSGADAAASSVRVKQLHSLLAATLDRAWSDVDVTAPLLAALPREVASSSALPIQRLAEKSLASVRRNVLNELQVILSEHRLAEKLCEVEFLAERGGLLLDDGTAMPPVLGHDAPAPDVALRSMVAKARRAERERLATLCQQMEEENAALQTEIQEAAERLAAAKAAVVKTEQHVDTVYDLLSDS